MLPGLLLFLIDAAIYYYLPPKTALTTIVLLSTLINTYTDLKDRYVDDQFVVQPIIFSILYSYQYGTVGNFIIINTIIIVFSFLLYILGAWSSGDITSMVAAAQILVITENPTTSTIQFITIFALLYFTIILAYATVKSRGKIYTKPPLLDTIEAALVVAALSNLIGKYYIIILLIASYGLTRIKKHIYHVLTIFSVAYIIYARIDPTIVTRIFIAMYVLSFIFSSTKGIKNYVFSRKVPGKLLKEGDVINEMIIKKDGTEVVIPITVKNIMRTKLSGYEFVVKPSSEGLSKEEVEHIHKKYPNTSFTIQGTIPLVPFIFATIVLFYFYVFIWG